MPDGHQQRNQKKYYSNYFGMIPCHPFVRPIPHHKNTYIVHDCALCREVILNIYSRENIYNNAYLPLIREMTVFIDAC